MIRCVVVISLLLFANIELCSQVPSEERKVIIEQWDIIDYNQKGGLVWNACQSVFGEILLVGEQMVKGKRKGFAQLINHENGQILNTITYPGNGRLLGLTQLEKGGFVLVGTKIENGQEKGWVVLTNADGQLIDEMAYAARENLEFQQVLITENNQLIAAGPIGNEKSGKIGVWSINLNNLAEVQAYTTIGNGAYEDLKGMRALNGQVQLIGNTQKLRKQVNAGNIWMHVLNDQLNTDHRLTQIIATESRERINNIHLTYRNEYLAFGDFIGGRTRNAFVYPIVNYQLSHNDFHVKRSANERLSMGLKTLGGQFLLAHARIEYNPPLDLKTYFVQLFQNKQQRLSSFEIPKLENSFELQQILETFDGSVLLAGFEVRDRENIFPRVIKLAGTDMFSPPKSTVELAFTQSPTLVEQGGNMDGILMPGEQLYIYFTIKNVGDAELYGGRIEVLTESKVNGLDFKTNAFIGLLEANQERSFYIPVNGAMNLMNADAEFSITVRKGNANPLLESIINLKCNPTQNGSSIEKEIILELKEPAAKSVRTLNGTQSIRLQILSNQPLNPNDFTIYIDNIPLPSSRSQDKLTAINQFSNLPFAYEFEKSLTFDQPGKYEVYIKVNGAQKDEVSPVRIIEYQPRTPNLHVISVGPTFGKYDLKYNVKDAEDFAGLMAEQVGQKGLYGELFLNELSSESLTTQTQIAALFEKLRARALPEYEKRDKIYPNDVLVIFISSHGKLVNGSLKIIPSDYDQEAEQSTTVDYKKDLLAYLESVDCKKLLFIDACHSGAAKSKSVMTDEDAYYAQKIIDLFNLSPGLTTLTSSQANQFSFEDDLWKNGAFTEALVEAFSGKGDLSRNNYLSINEIYSYIEKRVPELIQEIHGDQSDRFRQEPALTRTGVDLDIDIFKIIN